MNLEEFLEEHETVHRCNDTFADVAALDDAFASGGFSLCDGADDTHFICHCLRDSGDFFAVLRLGDGYLYLSDYFRSLRHCIAYDEELSADEEESTEEPQRPDEIAA